MKKLFLSLLGFVCIGTSAHSQTATAGHGASFDLESGMLWQVGHNTSIDYLLVPTQLVFRSRPMLDWDFDGGSLVLRNRFALQAMWVAEGPESLYLAGSAAPSLEWWDKDGAWSVFMAAGGGVGTIDSQGIDGGQGQDRTLNWFARAGMSRALSEGLHLNAGVMFQHMSNGGATDPNPGIDALGFMMGCSWKF